MGEVSPYSEDERAKAIERVIAGLSEGLTLAELCRGDGMPCRGSVYAWRDADPELAKRIAHARDLGFDAIAESALEIADDARNDWMERRNEDGSLGGAVLNGEHVQRSKLRIETRLKLLAKWSPKYADKIAHVGGGADDPAIRHALDLSNLTDDQKRALASIKLPGDVA